MPSVLGWDIGGVNTKVALVVDGQVRHVRSAPFEIQRAPDRLTPLLIDVAAAMPVRPDAHAITMTAELSQMFRTKRDGVRFVLDAVEHAFPRTAVYVYATDGSFVTPAEGRARPLAVGAANWVATASVVARHHRDALLVDVGTTTTDLIPICGGQVAASGRTDPERLASGELVYSGAVRTPVEAIIGDAPFGDGRARVSAEGFALAGDAHVWLGDLAPEDYEAATPDGRPPTRKFAAERLARVICADRELLDDQAVRRIAEAIAQEQVKQIAIAIRQVTAHHPSIAIAVVTGLGAFIGERAAGLAGLAIAPLSVQLGEAGARSAPATAVALLLDEQLTSVAGARGERIRHVTPVLMAPANGPAGCVRVTVIKIGGSLLRVPAQWRAALAAIAATPASTPVLVVPGGGPFADAVREVDARFTVGDHAAHWMAIGGMDQHAEMIAATGVRFARVASREQIDAAHRLGRVPVLAPLQWLRAEDPLPHSWDVTSDSIAGWIASALAPARLLLVKAEGATGPTVVDPYFPRAAGAALEWSICDAWSLEAQLSNHEPSRR